MDMVIRRTGQFQQFITQSLDGVGTHIAHDTVELDLYLPISCQEAGGNDEYIGAAFQPSKRRRCPPIGNLHSNFVVTVSGVRWALDLRVRSLGKA